MNHQRSLYPPKLCFVTFSSSLTYTISVQVFVCVLICYYYCSSDLFNLEEFQDDIKCTELTKFGKQSYNIWPNSLSTYAAKNFELPKYFLRASFDSMLMPYSTFVA